MVHIKKNHKTKKEKMWLKGQTLRSRKLSLIIWVSPKYNCNCPQRGRLRRAWPQQKEKVMYQLRQDAMRLALKLKDGAQAKEYKEHLPIS